MIPLTAADLAMFARFGVGPELLAKAKISRLTDPETREILALNGTFGDMAGIVFPYLSPHTGFRVAARVRRDHPEIENGHEKNKYMSAYGDRKHLYVVPGSEALLADLIAPVVLVEAEKSALAIWAWSQRTTKRLLPIAMGGCYGWRGRIGKRENSKGHRVDELGPLPDLEWCRKRRTYVLLDSNCATNPKVRAARHDLVRALVKLEADVRVLNLPAGDGINGPDDYVSLKGDAALEALFEGAAAEREHEPLEFSEDMLALTFSSRNPGLRYTEAWGKWHRWTGLKFEEDRGAQVFQLAREVCREAGRSSPDKNLACRVASAKTRAAVVSQARHDPRHSMLPEQWDADDNVISTPAGIVDLHSGQLREAQPSDYCTKITASGPAEFVRANSLWLKFMDRVTGGDLEFQSFLQRIAGYCLTGSVKEEAVFFFYGDGQNGKSKFLQALSDLMHEYSRVAPVSLLLATKTEHHPTELAGLHGARLVTAIEAKSGQRWDEAKLCALTGGDTVTARYMRGDFFDFVPKFKILVAANHKPGLINVNKAVTRRLHLIPFTVTIPEEERDFELAMKLRREQDQILRWAIDGCLEWRRIGLAPPLAVHQATEAYFASQDVIARWLAERCETGVNFREKTTNLFNDWTKWTEAQKETTGKKRVFTEDLQRRGFSLGGDGRRYLYGIRLLDEQQSGLKDDYR